eukprot:2825252-Alexandrium_andersonii.AAC.1
MCIRDRPVRLSCWAPAEELDPSLPPLSPRQLDSFTALSSHFALRAERVLGRARASMAVRTPPNAW